MSASSEITPLRFRKRPVVISGHMGWGNPDRSPSNLTMYGPGGRWNGPTPAGDCMDHVLERSGIYEGARVIVVCVPSRFDAPAADDLAQRIQALVDATEETEP